MRKQIFYSRIFVFLILFVCSEKSHTMDYFGSVDYEEYSSHHSTQPHNDRTSSKDLSSSDTSSFLYTFNHHIWEPTSSLSEEKRVLIFQLGKGGCYEEYQPQFELFKHYFSEYTLATVDWPNQSFSQKGTIANPIHATHFDDYVHFFSAYLDRYFSDVKKIDLIGLSMGGNILTHFAHQHPDRVQSLTLLSPMFRFPTPPFSFGATYYLSALACLLGYGPTFTIGQGPFDQEHFLEMLRGRAHICQDKIQTLSIYLDDHNVQGAFGVTWSWLCAAIQACYEIDRITLPESIPLTLISTPDDDVILPEFHEIFVSRHPHAEFVEIKEMPHDPLLASDDTMSYIFQHIQKRLFERKKNSEISISKVLD